MLLRKEGVEGGRGKRKDGRKRKEMEEERAEGTVKRTEERKEDSGKERG